MIKWIILSWAAMLPLLVVLIYYTQKQTRIVMNQIRIKRTKDINYLEYDKLELKIVDTDYILPKGQIAHFTYDALQLEIGQKERRYIGNSKSGIRLPFMRLSFQDKTFIEGSKFVGVGAARVTITNKIIKVMTAGDTPTRKEIKLYEVERLRVASTPNTVEIATNMWAWPIRVTFNSKEEAEEFQNAVWTVIYEYKNKKRRYIPKYLQLEFENHEEYKL